MTPERWQRIKAVLENSLELNAAERADFLSSNCAGDPEMLKEIESLIASYEQAGDILERPAIESGAEVVSGYVDAQRAGELVGPYRILEEIGQGGMGTVYRAVRADETFDQEVAIKIVKRGMDIDFILHRFHHERQILASLGHPNIARLLDGGTTHDGLPYFVMEYIKGRPIDAYCDSHRLSIADRLGMFRAVCSAVAFAHGHSIIHRDIKPGNILIAEDGVPKLLDFGIAKILEARAASAPTSNPTETILHLMTPEYASPEQICGRHVTAATDIYSLGVLLYELLTGHKPYSLRNRPPHEVAQVINEKSPKKPSSAVARDAEIIRDGHTTRISSVRGATPEKLRRSLGGDLDNIVMMAMRKEPQRRYASVELLSEDIRRHLEGLPVSARKDTLAYRASKLARRNKPAFIAAALAAPVLIFAGIVGSRLERTRVDATEAGSKIVPFTSFGGHERQPSFSPDGKKIVFVWGGENDDNSDVYVKSLDDGSMVRITKDPAEDVSPAWAPDSRRIAFLRTSAQETAVFVAPGLNGIHGKIADVYPNRAEAVGRHLDWSTDGRYLALSDKNAPEEPFSIVAIRAADGQKKRLTFPPAASIGDSSPAFSPDGKNLAFIRSPSSGVNDLYTMPLNGGAPRRVTFDNRWIIGEVWTADSRALVYSSDRMGGRALWRIPTSGGVPVQLPGIGGNVSDPSFSRDGTRMAFMQSIEDANIWQIEVSRSGRASSPPRKLIASTQLDTSPQYSPDGQKIVFRSNRSGNNEIWVTDAEGRNAVQLTHSGGPLTGTPRWSPDGGFIAFDSRPQGQADIFIIAATGGTPRRLTTENAEDVAPSWSRDGEWVYFASNRSGSWQLWKAPSSAGLAVQVTKAGGFAAFESPDREFIYYAKGRSVPGLWRVPVRGGPETPVIPDLKASLWGYWAVSDTGIYFAQPSPDKSRGEIVFYDLKTGKMNRVADIQKPLRTGDSAFALSPDGRHILYSQWDENGSDIMIMERAKAK